MDRGQSTRPDGTPSQKETASLGAGRGARVSGLNALDLFAGPGGWDVGAQALGLEPLGIEWDDAAVQTRKAAGLRTACRDVATCDPDDYGPVDLLIASPPCQAWSMAGKRQGQEDIEQVYDLTRRLANGEDAEDAVCGYDWADPRSPLVTEPLRWALALKPRLIAWEQVPPVLDYWKFCADILRAEGYSVWTGILSAERYGVPQTRKRAILMASLDGPVEPPRPTHQAYTAGEPAWAEPMVSLEGELKPWVSMAEALGWNQAVNTDRSGERADEKYEPTEPGPTVTARARRWHKVDVPAPTVTGGGGDTGGPEPFGRGGREQILRSHQSIDGEDRAYRDPGEPAITICGGSKSATWVDDRPSTTVAGDPRVHPPGHKINQGDRDAGRDHYEGRAGENAVRVTIEEASILQGFDPSYPWQGSRTKQFQQIGNAVPPPLAQAILGALVGAAELEKAA